MAKQTKLPASERITNCQPTNVEAAKFPLQPTVISVEERWPEDLRESWWPVSDQEKTGACVGFGVGDGLIRWYLVKKNKITTKQAPSARYFWMAAKEMDEYGPSPSTFLEGEGTSVWAALEMGMLYGCLLESELSFSGKLFSGATKEFLFLAADRKIGIYHQLERTVDAWIKWMRINGPLACRLSVDRAFERASSNRPNLDTHEPYSDAWNHGHAVTIVGYLKAEERFIIRNSWGKSWGDEGFAYASPEYAASAFKEVWGIYY
jgi:hypothetical protein